MLEQESKYDPTVYGRLRAEFLRNIDPISDFFNQTSEYDEETMRLKLLEELQEGKLVKNRE